MRGSEFVEKVCGLFNKRYEFTVWESSLSLGDDSCTVILSTGEKVRFDIQMKKGDDPQAIFYYCECKWRADPGTLRSEFIDFLGRARKILDFARHRYRDRFRFMFFSNVPSGIRLDEIQNIDEFKKLAGADIPGDDLKLLIEKVRLVVLDDWLLRHANGGSD